MIDLPRSLALTPNPNSRYRRMTKEGKSNEGGMVTPDGRNAEIDFSGGGAGAEREVAASAPCMPGRGSRRRANEEGENEPAANTIATTEVTTMQQPEKEEKKKRSLFGGGGSRRKAKETATPAEASTSEPSETEVTGFFGNGNAEKRAGRRDRSGAEGTLVETNFSP